MTSNNIQYSVAHIVGNYLFRNGTWIYNQIAHLQRWRPVVLCNRTENLDAYPVEHLYAVEQQEGLQGLYNKLARRIVGYYPAFKSLIRKESISVIHAHFGPAAYQALALARTERVPLVTTFYGYDLSRLPQGNPEWRKRYSRLFDEGQFFLVEGHFMRQQLIELGCPPEKARVLHLGVDLKRLPFILRRPANDGFVRILVAASFTEKKGLPYAIEAFCRLCQSYNRVYMTVIGDARERPDEQAIKQDLLEMVARFGVEKNVRFLGFQPYTRLIEEFYRHHIFLSPSVQAMDGNNEGGAPVTIIEASATGMPVVSTTHCDIPSVVIDRASGLLVDERDVCGIVNALSFLVENPDQWAVMGSAGRAHIEKAYDVKQTAHKLEEHYNSLLNRRKPTQLQVLL